MKLINTSYPLLENQHPLELSLSPSSTYTCIDLFVKHNIYQTHHFIFHGHASVLVINPHSTVEEKMEEQVNGKKQRKQKSKVAAEGVETDYVRVKARRGQATDSHSLAERARRAKIRMRMKLLQSLVPGCDKITGKAHLLDAIIKHVQLLQNQVESLAAKLAFVDLMLFDCEPNPSANPYNLEGLYHYEPPLPSLPESSSIAFMSFADAAPSDSASLLLTEDQRASLVFQDGENFLLDMDDQYRGDIVDQPEAGLDNLCTF